MLECAPDLLNNPPYMNSIPPLARSRSSGFTLIELMIAVAVVGILLAVALPSFMDSIRKGRRSEAFTALSAIQQSQERWRSNRAAYTTTLADLGVTSSVSTPGGYYTLSIDSASPTAYVLTAVGSGSQLNDGPCANLSLELNAGAIRYASCTGTGCAFTYAASDRCWAR